MATLADSLVSSSARTLPVRRRPDLTARRQRYLGRSYWIVKDPVGLHYFRFQEEEYAILQMLDGQTSLDQIKEQFEEQFPPQKITLEELQQFLGMLHRSGLVIAGVPGQGRQLCKRRAERRRQELTAALTNILCIRFKGFDPEQFLNWLYSKVKWYYHPITMIGCMLFALSALTLIMVQFDVFRSKLPEFHQFFSPENAIWLAVVLGATKVIHEFGHGLSCKHFGGECHEMGVMVLVLTPCLYCNVSDSWMLPSKWQRAFIGAAGMYNELVLASFATYFWWFSHPGLMNNLALNIIFVSSVSTVLFNANPLLRYDGYYILSDLTEIPNLRQKATSILNRKASEWFLGMESPDDPFLPERNQIFFALYSIAAAIYRWVVLFSILFFLYKIFEPYGLQIIGQTILTVSLVSLVGQPLYRLGKFFYVPGRWDKVKKPRMYGSLAVVGVLVMLVLWLPLPASVVAPVEIRLHEPAVVYIEVPGRLEEICVHPGDTVVKGQKLGQLSSIDLDLEIASQRMQLELAKMRLDNLKDMRFADRQTGEQIRQAESEVDSRNKELWERLQDRQRLTLRAPREGIVFPPDGRLKREHSHGQLGSWTLTPLEPQNMGAYLEDTRFCQIGDPRQMEAMLVVDQADIDFIRKGQRVRIKLDELPHDTLEGQITEIASDAMTDTSPRLAAKNGGEVPTVTDPSTGVERPQSASYKVRVPLQDPHQLLRIGLRGRARIYMDFSQWQTLGQRLWRLIHQTFNFRL